jgi:Skp family chaperone for outer membrane proteins
MAWRWAALLALLLVPQAAPAQDQAELPVGQLRSPVLIIDTERVFSESQFGLRVAADVQRDSEALVAENRRIEAALTEEERGLTLRRPSMAVADFRAEADAFDERVQGIRQAQDAKQRALQDGIVTGRDQFLQAATPILGQIMQDSGAAVILDRRSVFLGIGTIDITDQAIARINAEIGDGSDLPVPAPAPDEGQN